MKTLVAFLVVLLLAFISVGGWMLARPNPLNEEVARLEAELQEVLTENAKLKADLVEQKKAGAPSMAASPSAPIPSGKPGAEGSLQSAVTANKNGGGSKGVMGEMRELMNNSGVKEMVKQQQVAQLEMQYGRLFELFELNPEEKENFKQLLAARLAVDTDLGLKLMDGNLDKTQRQQIMSELTAAKKASDETIKTFLGNDEDYKTFKHWEDTQPERMQFDMLGGRSHFTSAGEPLTPQQETKLIEVMTAVRKSPSPLPDLSKTENISGENLTDDMVQKQLQKFDRDASTVTQNAAGFLSPTQLQALAKMQQQMRSLSEAGLKMSGAMMKGGK